MNDIKTYIYLLSDFISTLLQKKQSIENKVIKDVFAMGQIEGYLIVLGFISQGCKKVSISLNSLGFDESFQKVAFKCYENENSQNYKILMQQIIYFLQKELANKKRIGDLTIKGVRFAYFDAYSILKEQIEFSIDLNPNEFDIAQETAESLAFVSF